MKQTRLKTRATDEELLPYMDYLHGDVVGRQFRTACQYEYARESNTLRRAAELLRCDPTANAGEIVFQIEHEFHCATWFISTDWLFIWRCPSFPAKSWNQLSEAERVELLYGLPGSTNKVQPLRLGEVMFLTRYLDQLKGMAERARAEWKEAGTVGRPREKVKLRLEQKRKRKIG